MKRRAIIAFIVIASLLAVFVIWNIGIIINLPNILVLIKCEYLYKTSNEHVILESASSEIENSIIKFKGLEFKHNFDHIIFEEKRENDYIIEFDQQKRLVIHIDSYPLIEPLNDNAKKLIADYYGEDTIKNNFNIMKKALEITPNDITWFSFSQKKIRQICGYY
ncbi:MAG: hypothetical protein ACOYIF_04610 [Acetivibrionales bacterium]